MHGVVGLAAGLSAGAGYVLTSPICTRRLVHRGSASTTASSAPTPSGTSRDCRTARRLRANKALELTAVPASGNVAVFHSCTGWSGCTVHCWRQLSLSVRWLSNPRILTIIPYLDFIHFKGCGAREPDIRRTVKTSHSASQSATSCMSYWS